MTARRWGRGGCATLTILCQVSSQGAVDGALTAKKLRKHPFDPRHPAYQSPSQKARMLRESKLARDHRQFVKQKLKTFTDTPSQMLYQHPTYMRRNQRLNPTQQKVRSLAPANLCHALTYGGTETCRGAASCRLRCTLGPMPSLARHALKHPVGLRIQTVRRDACVQPSTTTVTPGACRDQAVFRK